MKSIDLKKSMRISFQLTILREEFHQGRLADDVAALARLFIDDGDTMTMLLHKSGTEIG